MMEGDINSSIFKRDFIVDLVFGVLLYGLMLCCSG